MKAKKLGCKAKAKHDVKAAMGCGKNWDNLCGARN